MSTAAVREALVGMYTGQALYASLHTADPGETGANELVGVTRQAVTWNAGAVDGEATSDPITFAMSAGTSVTHVSVWDAATAGNFVDSYANSVTYDSAGDYTITLKYIQS